MAKKFVSRCIVLRNGSRVSNMKNFKFGAITYRGETETNDGGGTYNKPRVYKFSLDYAIPKDSPKLDWSDIEDEDWTIELEGGKRVNYTGVDCLDRGEISIDQEKESVMTINFRAQTESIE